MTAYLRLPPPSFYNPRNGHVRCLGISGDRVWSCNTIPSFLFGFQASSSLPPLSLLFVSPSFRFPDLLSSHHHHRSFYDFITWPFLELDSDVACCVFVDPLWPPKSFLFLITRSTFTSLDNVLAKNWFLLLFRKWSTDCRSFSTSLSKLVLFPWSRPQHISSISLAVQRKIISCLPSDFDNCSILMFLCSQFSIERVQRCGKVTHNVKLGHRTDLCCCLAFNSISFYATLIFAKNS